MSLPWTFGVELEFALAFVYPPSVPLPEPTKTRKLRFKPYRYEIDRFISSYDLQPIHSANELADRMKYGSIFTKALVTPAIRRDIALTLHNAGLPVNLMNPECEDVLKWKITIDGTVPYAYTPENLQAVEKGCNIISEKYLIEVNSSTGLHIHVSAGLKTPFRLETMQNLFAFLYAFEPQLDSLHPEHRQHDNEYCSYSLRKHSNFIRNWWNEHGQLPTIIQGMIELLKKKKTKMELLNAVRWTFNDKAMRYNVSNLVKYLQDEDEPSNSGIPTIEFRQHEGTLDAQRVVQWCSTVVGIINFVDTADQVYLRNLLLKVDKFGPIPAEGSFTVIDLFRYMHLNEQAKFYSSRLNPVVGRPPNARPTVWKWEYEEMYSHGLLTDEEYQRHHELRLFWEKSLTAAEA
ncbi:hypothetical protein NA56DRAFT_706362 [Hyaloscypha hepaticicola]|uniref:Amidoligase enzyme n=1 Tax=Hyaloscypha hepaticicola TaxID=2082293 RepID=A0A2J6PXQ9_9HELO|nr:hypothetical protein NA56DRAFT_706362 [Hyaloscypha hepaticicola]